MLEVPVTTLRALLPSGAAPGVSAVASRLRDAGLQLSPDVGASCRWCLRGELPRGEGMPGLAVAVTLRPCRGLPPHSEGLGAEEAAAADFELDVEARLGVDPLADYHALLRVTAAVAPDLVLMVDEGSSAVRFPEWVHETAETAAPPSPRVLYTVHAVRRNGRAWVHTHGLVRAGAIELEMLDVPEEALSCLAPLVHAVAAQWLEQGPPCPGEKFEAGRDLELAWAPWPKANREGAPGRGRRFGRPRRRPRAAGGRALRAGEGPRAHPLALPVVARAGAAERPAALRLADGDRAHGRAREGALGSLRAVFGAPRGRARLPLPREARLRGRG
ncbi:MAG: DUF4026 domain-containing protein [Sandaracinus sp.]|nr:DUF4026 domain-containing protein [Sandaracinus sp.]